MHYPVQLQFSIYSMRDTRILLYDTIQAIKIKHICVNILFFDKYPPAKGLPLKRQSFSVY